MTRPFHRTKIAYEDICVVVQGAVIPELIESVYRSVRQALPGAELILSTWKGTKTGRLPAFDQLILSDDPGAIPLILFPESPERTVNNNVNRQIVSTLAGAKAASRSHLLKIRTDMTLTGHNGFLDHFGRYDVYTPGYHFLRERVINNASGTRSPDMLQVCFHPGDFFYFGYREDVLDLFDIPLYRPRPLAEVLEEGTLNALLHAEGDAGVFLRNLRRHMVCEFYPEIYLFRSFLLKHTNELKTFRSSFDYGARWQFLSNVYMVNHFVFLQDKQIGIKSLKYPHFECDYFLSSLDHELWQVLYQQYCDSSHKLESISPYVDGFHELYRAKIPLRSAAFYGGVARFRVVILWTYFRILANVFKSYRSRKAFFRRFLKGSRHPDFGVDHRRWGTARRFLLTRQ